MAVAGNSLQQVLTAGELASASYLKHVSEEQSEAQFMMMTLDEPSDEESTNEGGATKKLVDCG